MGKQQALPSHSADSLGIPDVLGNNPVLQEAVNHNSQTRAGLYNGPESSDFTKNFTPSTLPASELNEAIAKGVALPSGYDPKGDEHAVADATPWYKEWAHGLTKDVLSIPLKLGEQAMNMASGVSRLLGADDFANSVDHNGFTDWLGEVSENLKNAKGFFSGLDTPASARYDSDNLMSKLMTAKFWADDVGDGAAFVLALALGSKGLGAAAEATGVTGGLKALSESENLAEIYKSIPVTQRIATATANGFTAKTVGFLDAAAISGMQAKGTANQIKAKLTEQYSSEVNPDTGYLYTPDEVQAKIAKDHQGMIDEKVNNTFWATMATELLPSIYASTMILGKAKNSMGEMNEQIVKAVNEGKITLDDIRNGVSTEVMRKAGLLRKGFNLGEVGKAAGVGTAAMNLQQSIQQYDVDQAVGGKAGGVMDSTMGYVNQFLSNFGNAEGMKSMIMGAVLGAGSAAITGGKGAKEQNEALKQHLDSLKAAEGLFGGIYAEAQRAPYQMDDQGKLKLDDKAQPIPDVDKIQKIIFGMLQNKSLYTTGTAALLAGNPDIATLNDHVAIAQSIVSELQSGRYANVNEARQFFKWFHGQRIREQAKADEKKQGEAQVAQSAAEQSKDPIQGQNAAVQTQTALSSGDAHQDADVSKAVNDNSQLVDKIFDAWKSTGKQASKLYALGDTPAKTLFNDNIRRGLFYEEIKRNALTEMMGDRKAALNDVAADRDQLDAETNMLSSLHTDSLQRSSDFLHKTDDIYKQWHQDETELSDRITNVKETREAYEANKTEDTKRAGDTAEYMAQEHIAKNGLQRKVIDPKTGDVDLRLMNNDVNHFPINEGLGDQANRVSVGLRQEQQFKAGNQYREMAEMNRMIKDRTEGGKTSLKEVADYAKSKEEHIDQDTHKQLKALTDQETKSLGTDKQRLAEMPQYDEQAMQEGSFEPNPEYHKLDADLDERSSAIDKLNTLSPPPTPLDYLSRPGKAEEMLNRKFAEQHLEKGQNVVANAMQDGQVKDNYSDGRAVDRAIAETTRMRNAMEDRLGDKGDLKGQEQYRYLINQADELLDQLKQIQKVVAENSAKRELIQQEIGKQQAAHLASGIGFSLESGEISSPSVFNLANTILDGHLPEMMQGVMEMPSNHFEGMMSILHAVKSSGTDSAPLLSAIQDSIDEAGSGLPPTDKWVREGFTKNPENYLEAYLVRLSKGNLFDSEQNNIFTRFKRTNDINQLEDDVANLPEEGMMGISKANLQNLVKTYKDITALQRVKNLVDSKVDLARTVVNEIAAGQASSGIVPTTEQEISIRDGLAWFHGDFPGTADFSGWAHLRGVAGTGKTSVVARWIVDQSGLDKSEVLATAATDKATEVLGNALSTEGKRIDELMQGEIPKGTHLILVDEYARVEINDMDEFQRKIKEHNKALPPEERVRVLLLGDPSQITSNIHSSNNVTDPIGNKTAWRIRALNPLATVYRSNVSAVTQTADAFQYATNDIPSINVRSSGEVYQAHNVGSHVGKTAQDIRDVIRVNTEAEQQKGLTPRSRVIVVDDMAKANQYADTGVPVISVYDTQSGTWDEVYVDMDKKGFNDEARFNSAMYTAASRAQEYSFLKYEGKNTTDPGLLYEKASNDQKQVTAKGDYIKDRTLEQKLQEQAIAGEAPEVPAKAEVISELPTLDLATEPAVAKDNTIETTPTIDPDQNLAPEVDSPGFSSPSGPVPPPVRITPENTMPGEHILPNVEGEAYHQSDNIGPGTPVHYLYARQPNGEDSILVVGQGKDGNYVPLSRIFQEEINTHPHYAEFKQKIADFKAKNIQPVTDITSINPKGNIAGAEPKDLPVLKSGSIAKYNRLTYDYTNENTKGTGLLKHISDIFRKRFYHANQADRATQVHYRIFRKKDLTNYKFSDGVRIEPGIPYAVVGVKPNASDFRTAQFVRLTVNPLDKSSEHYQALKSYRDGVADMESRTGIRQGSTAYNWLIKGLKNSLEIREEAKGQDGTEPVVHPREDFTREHLRTAIQEIASHEKTSIPEELDALLDPTSVPDKDFEGILPKLQALATQFYGIKQENEVLSAKESLEKYGDKDYKHVAFKNQEGDDARGLTALKDSLTPGRKAKYKTAYSLEAGKGRAQVALNQLARANEFAGPTRIRVEDHAARVASGGRIVHYTGKSLIGDEGGGAVQSRSREVLRQMLGESKVASGELKPEELDSSEVKKNLNKEIRERAGAHEGTIPELGETILKDSGLPDDRAEELRSALGNAQKLKDTLPINMDTLDMMVGDKNYNDQGEHYTADKFNVTGHYGETKSTNTYLRKPLGIDEFNQLGADPEKNAQALAGMVGTKLADIYPTQVSVRHEDEQPVPKEKQAPPPTVPGVERESENRISELIAETTNPDFRKLPAKERMAKLKELNDLRSEQNSGTRRLFDTSSEDPGQKISTEEARAEFHRLLPGASPSELEFADRSRMIELQRPGESLLGLFHNNKITILDENGVYKGVLRHEIFHSVWNDYLTQRDRNRFLKAFDPYGKMDPVASEEALANHFMTYQSQPEEYKPVLRRIFDKIKSWLGFAQDNASTLNDLFRRIENGEFQQKTPETANTRMAFSDMSKYDSLQDYKNTSKIIEDLIYRLHVDDRLDNDPVTREELPKLIYQKLQEELSKTESIIDSNVNAANDFKEEYHLSDDPEYKEELQGYIDSINQETNGLNQDYGILYKLTGTTNGESMFRDLWKDLYPNIDLDKEIHDFQVDDEKTDPELMAKSSDELEDDRVLTGLGDFTKQSDERNQETKTTESIKNFLSFIYRPARAGKEEASAKRISPRYAYYQSLRNLAGLSSSDGNFITQLRNRAEENGINLAGTSDGSMVVNHILHLHENATNPHYTFKTGETDDYGRQKTIKVDLDKHQRFIDEDTFVTHLRGKDIRGMNPEELKLEGDNITTIERKGRITPDFLTEVGGMVGADKAKGYFRQMQAQESLRELYSTFLSQREAQPMIAESEYTQQGEKLRYFRAQNYGAERTRTTDIENAFSQNYQKLSPKDWEDINLARLGKKTGMADSIVSLLSKMGIREAQDVPRKNTKLVQQIAGDLDAFETQLKQAILDRPKPDSADEELDDYNPVAATLEQNKGMLDRITKLITRNQIDQRASSYLDVKKTKRYIFHNGSQAYDTLGKMVDHTNARENEKPELPTHFKDPVLSKNIFASGLNQIFSVTDHDGWRQKGREEFAISYRDESNKNWLERNFSYGFLSFLRANATKSEDIPLTYVQHFYTVSNRPRISGAEVKVLGHDEVHEALKNMVTQHVTQPDMPHVKGYDRFRAVGFDELHQALKDLYPKELDDKAKLYDKIQAHPEEVDKVARRIGDILKSQVPDIIRTMEEENVAVSDAHEGMKVLKDKGFLDKDTAILEGPVNTKEFYPSADQLSPSVELFHLNNYVNSFGITQAVAGNLNYFKDGENLIKRMSGIFAPGTKGTVGEQFFMKPKFKLMVSHDVKLQKDTLSKMLEDTALAKSLKAEGFDITDAQGFMTPERKGDIAQGFGKSYSTGQVFKPAHYEVADRGDGNYVPVMLKYSSVVISDDLAKRFPKLAALRDKMRSEGADELLFDTGVKVGAPDQQATLPLDPNDHSLSVPDGSILTLSNENYRLQLNPNHDAFDGTANPTQLGYFMNVAHKLSEAGSVNLENASKLYQAISDRITRGIAKQSTAALDTEGKFQQGVLRSMFKGVGNERIHEMLGNGINYNFPNIADKALIQMANLVSKKISQIRFPGGKLTLQSSYGADIPPDIQDSHDKFWSQYGKDESAKLQGQARRLEYKEDPATGRWHAEVIVPDTYRDKANVGDFLLPDLMGFRIPSTELHSSVPLKIAGYYDSKGSNVVIAPPELVAQHGSDFDVDSLYVISRETASSHTWEHGADETNNGDRIISKGMPVGYYPGENGKMQFDPERFMNHLNEQRAIGAENKPLLAKIEKLHDQMLNNQVVESFLDTISHPANKERMLSPISTEVVEDTMKQLGLEKDSGLNPSNLLHNMRLFNSNFQGLSLTGIFANGMKALAYMVRTGADGEYPTFQDEPLQVGDKSFGPFTETDSAGRTLWEDADALINAAVDNVKLQLLYPINATDRTGMAYLAAKAKGMTLPEAAMLINQPVIQRYSHIAGGRNTLMPNLKAEMVAKAIDLGILTEGQKYEDIGPALATGPEVLTEKALKAGLKQSGFGEDSSSFGIQYHTLEQFSKLQKIGEDVNTFSRAIGVLQGMPVFYSDIAGMKDLWDSMGMVTPEGTFKTKDSFSFNLDNLFQAQPNIKAAYDAFQFMKAGVDKSLIKHQPAFQALAEELNGNSLKLAQDKNTNIELLKNEAMNYMVSSYYAKSLKDQEPVRVKIKNGTERVMTGKAAWGYMLMSRLEGVIAEDRKLPYPEQNPFLRRISIKDQGYGNRTIEFANSSNPDAMEALEMQEGFGAVKDEQVKQDLVKYAALNYGMQFGIRNYSMFIPTDYIKPLSDYISNQVEEYTRNSTMDEEGNLASGPLYNLRNNLALKMAVNYPDKLIYLPKKKFPPITTLDVAGKEKTIDIGDKTLPVKKGYDGTHYWDLAYENPVKENGTREHKFPDLMYRKEGQNSKGEGRDVAFVRVNDNDNDRVYYQRLGYKNYMGGYDATPEAITGEYKQSDYFGTGTIPVPVRDIEADKYETRNEYVQPGQRVLVHPWSNETRELGKFGIVDKVQKLGDKNWFTLKPEVEGEPEKTEPQVDYISAIAKELGERANLPVVFGALPKGTKGSLANVITLDPRQMTPDTPYHEVAHPLIAAIQVKNPAWYSKLQEELHTSKEGKTILKKVQAKYKDLDKPAQEREALVTAIGLEAARRLESGSFRDMVRRLMRSAGSLLKSVLQKVRGGESLKLDDLKDEDMVKLTIGDISDILAHGRIKLDLSATPSEESFSRDLDDEKPKGMMEAILERSNQIIDPEVDENGKQGDTYSLGEDKLMRASKVMEKFLFRKREQTLGPDGKPVNTEDAIAKREADRVFKNTPPDTKLIVDGKQYTKDEYQAARKKFQVMGMLKGDIIHAQLQRFFTTDPTEKQALTEKIAGLSNQAEVTGDAYNWITQNKVLGPILKNAGIHVSNDIPEANRDQVRSEVKVASPELGAGKIDQLVQRTDGRLRVVDWKTGSRLRDRYTSNILRYGLQEQHITDNPLDRAKLQVTLYSMMIKAEHPEAKFDGGVVMHIPNEWEATQGRNAMPVEFSSYLKMIEQYIQHEEPENYRKLLEKSPLIFDPHEYNAPRDPSFTQDVANSRGSTDAEVLHRNQLQLQNLVFNVDHGEDSDGWNRANTKLRNNLLKKILEGHTMVPVDFTGELDSQYEISVMKRWLGNINDTHNPYIQTWATMFNLKKEAARQELLTRQREFKVLGKAVMDELGIHQSAAERAFGFDKKIYTNLIRTEVEEKNGESYTHRYLVEKGMVGYDQLTSSERALADYTAKHMREIFEHVMTKGPEAIVDPNSGLTKLDLYNKAPKGGHFEYKKGFLPAVAITEREVAQESLRHGDIYGWAKDKFLRRMTDYFENNVEGYNQSDYGIPVRYLRDTSTSPDHFTNDLQYGFEKYMEQMINKKHMDSVWVAGQALKGYLEAKKNTDGSPMFKQSAAFMADQIKTLMETDKARNIRLSRHGASVYINGEKTQISTTQLFRSVKSAIAATNLFLKPLSATKNWAQMEYMGLKEEAINSILRHGNFKGVNLNELELSAKHHASSALEAIGGQFTQYGTSADSNFVHQLAKQLRLYPDMSEMNLSNADSLTRGARLLTTKQFGYLYQATEEVTSVQYALSFMKAMKIDSGPYAGKSMYNMYKENFNPATGEFKLPNDFRRGQILTPQGTYEELAGLHPMEVQHIHRGIQKIKGGYRQDERTALQANMLGDLFMQFKRWIPGMLVQQFTSKYADPSIGQFEKRIDATTGELDRHEGEDVYQWRARVVEGRWKVLGKWFANLATFGRMQGYAWADMSTEQKKSLMDAGLSFATWTSLGLGLGMMSHRKDQDTLKQFTSSLQDRLFEQWNTITLLEEATTPPAAVQRITGISKGLVELMKGGVTNKGDLKGLALVEKNVPYLASYYELHKEIADWDTSDIWDTSNPYQ